MSVDQNKNPSQIGFAPSIFIEDMFEDAMVRLGDSDSLLEIPEIFPGVNSDKVKNKYFDNLNGNYVKFQKAFDPLIRLFTIKQKIQELKAPNAFASVYDDLFKEYKKELLEVKDVSLDLEDFFQHKLRMLKDISSSDQLSNAKTFDLLFSDDSFVQFFGKEFMQTIADLFPARFLPENYKERVTSVGNYGHYGMRDSKVGIRESLKKIRKYVSGGNTFLELDGVRYTLIDRKDRNGFEVFQGPDGRNYIYYNNNLNEISTQNKDERALDDSQSTSVIPQKNIWRIINSVRLLFRPDALEFKKAMVEIARSHGITDETVQASSGLVLCETEDQISQADVGTPSVSTLSVLLESETPNNVPQNGISESLRLYMRRIRFGIALGGLILGSTTFSIFSNVYKEYQEQLELNQKIKEKGSNIGGKIYGSDYISSASATRQSENIAVLDSGHFDTVSVDNSMLSRGPNIDELQRRLDSVNIKILNMDAALPQGDSSNQNMSLDTISSAVSVDSIDHNQSSPNYLDTVPPSFFEKPLPLKKDSLGDKIKNFFKRK